MAHCVYSKIGNTNPLGHKDSDATRKKKSLAAKIRPKSKEFVEWMHKDKSGDKHPHFGKTWNLINGKRVYSEKK